MLARLLRGTKAPLECAHGGTVGDAYQTLGINQLWGLNHGRCRSGPSYVALRVALVLALGLVCTLLAWRCPRRRLRHPHEPNKSQVVSTRVDAQLKILAVASYH